MTCPLPVIGVVHTARHSTETTPVQAGLNRSEHATLEIAQRFTEALDGLEAFDYAWILSWLHGPDDARGGPAALRHVPFLLRRRQRRIGIFATRGPRRINPIGLSLVRVVEVSGNTVRFAGVDLVDGTPVLDLKPYVTRFDRPPGEPRCGWFDTTEITEGVTPADLAGPE